MKLFMQRRIEKYTQDIIDETERLDIWKTKGQLVKAKKYVSDLLSKVYGQGVEDGVKNFRLWLVSGSENDDEKLTVKQVKEDATHAISDVMDWCMVCNKANGKLSEDGICKDCI